jgi:hydrogenase expression/formation protein HypD
MAQLALHSRLVGAQVEALLAQIEAMVTRHWTIMEICGGQTYAILKHGLDQLLPPALEFVHGPGCPVCVTPVAKIDSAIGVSRRPGVMLCTLGDMMRVPGSSSDLASAKARGAAVRVVYSPLDAVTLAQNDPDRQVVYFAIGFETTAPANAVAILQARELGLRNFSVISAQVLVPPAVEMILTDPACRIDALLAAGHVCTVMGYREYEAIAEQNHVPIVVTGFEPADILRGVLAAVRQLETGRHGVENQYARAVRRDGNSRARRMIDTVFEAVDCAWRGLGPVPRSGLGIRADFAQFDAQVRHHCSRSPETDPVACHAGEILQGKLRPDQCPAFGDDCSPDMPLGAPMVSAEGACAAYFHAGRRAARAQRDHTG